MGSTQFQKRPRPHLVTKISYVIVGLILMIFITVTANLLGNNTPNKNLEIKSPSTSQTLPYDTSQWFTVYMHQINYSKGIFADLIHGDWTPKYISQEGGTEASNTGGPHGGNSFSIAKAAIGACAYIFNGAPDIVSKIVTVLTY